MFPVAFCGGCFRGLTPAQVGRRKSMVEAPQPEETNVSGSASWASPCPLGPVGGAAAARGRAECEDECEQLLASLATAERSEAAIRSLLPTATYETLATVPPGLLRARSEAGQELRRRLAQGATVVFVSAGLPSKRFAFEKAASLGIKSVVIDHPTSWAAGLVEAGVIAKFLPVDMGQSPEAIYGDCLSLIGSLGEGGGPGRVAGVATFVELSVPLVSRLTEALGLPGHRPAAVDAARNKHSTRACLKAAGLPTPRNALIRSREDLEAAGSHVEFPAVLKPVSGAASLGVKKVASEREMYRCYDEIVEELQALVISSGALTKDMGRGSDNTNDNHGDGDNGGKSSVKASQSVDLTVLMEQYLDGDEVDVDVVMSGGQWVYAAVSDNGPTLEPYFNETWAVSPSLLPKEKQVAVKELSIRSVEALGFSSGVFHVECKYTSSGPQLIEVNARMGGGQVRECNLLTWGVDMVEETLFAALGIPARPYVPRQPLTAVAYCYVNAAKSGRVADLAGLESLRELDGVVWAKPLVRTGEEAVGPADGLPTWLCDLLVTRPTALEALALLQALEAGEPVKVEES